MSYTKLVDELSNIMKSKTNITEAEIREVVDKWIHTIKEKQSSTPIPELSQEYIDNFRLKLESSSKMDREEILISILECSGDYSHDITSHPEIKDILKKNYKEEIIEINNKLKQKIKNQYL